MEGVKKEGAKWGRFAFHEVGAGVRVKFPTGLG